MRILPIMIVSIFVFWSTGFSSQVQEYLHSLETASGDNALKAKDEMERYVSFDFSSLLKPKNNFLGYIGNDYKRLYITFASIKKDLLNPKIYTVSGTSRVGNNTCVFTGTIKIQQVREYQKMHLGLDDEFKDKLKAQGLLIGNYRFEEEKSAKASGIFEGIMTVAWYIDKSGNLHYDDIEAEFSDGYKNNQYVGTWTSYGKKVGKVANWGEHRIPFSGDLDIGAAEFGANPKYKSKGWADN